MGAVRTDLGPLRRLINSIRRDSVSSRLAKQWAKIYSAHIKKRFSVLSRGGSFGGSHWRPLKKSTIARRRKGKTKGALRAAILRDTGTLFSGLSVGDPGNLVKKIKHGVRFGYSANKKHPTGYATIGDIAYWHDQGKGNVPQRRILMNPDKPTVDQMFKAIRLDVDRRGRRIGGRR